MCWCMGHGRKLSARKGRRGGTVVMGRCEEKEAATHTFYFLPPSLHLSAWQQRDVGIQAQENLNFFDLSCSDQRSHPPFSLTFSFLTPSNTSLYFLLRIHNCYSPFFMRDPSCSTMRVSRRSPRENVTAKKMVLMSIDDCQSSFSLTVM